MDGTVAEMRADDCTVKLAETPPSLTDVTPVKPEPMIRICAPVLPKAGEKPVTFGAPPPEPVTVNSRRSSRSRRRSKPRSCPSSRRTEPKQ